MLIGNQFVIYDINSINKNSRVKIIIENNILIYLSFQKVLILILKIEGLVF